MKKILIFLCLICVNIALAQSDEFYETAAESMEPYIGSELGVVSSLYSDEIIGFYINNIEFANAKLEDGILVEFNKGLDGNETLLAYFADEAALIELFNSDDPLSMFYQMQKEDKLVIEAVSFPSKVKFVFAKIIGRIVNWFV